MMILIKVKEHRISAADDFNNGKMYKISNVLNDILYIGVTCDALETCLSNYNTESKLKRTQLSFDFFRMFNSGIRNVKIEFIESFPSLGKL
jgi:hypothetical protein